MEISRSQVKFLDSFVLLAFIAIAIVLSLRPLVDVDLGWHLAGGLWMLENKQLPQIDPLGSQRSFWLCYSWLSELVFAWVYNLGGFEAIRYFQVLTVSIIYIILFFFARSLLTKRNNLNNLQQHFLLFISYVLLIIFVTPISYLRPQLFSIVFFVLLLDLALKDQLKISLVLPLVLIWVNIHVYWVFAALIVATYKILSPNLKQIRWKGFLDTAFVTFCGFFNPYGWKHFLALKEYAFNHRQAYLLINEFQPLNFNAGITFWMFWIVLLLLVSHWKLLLTLNDKRPFILVIIFTIATIIQRKYIPLFGLTSTILLTQAIFPNLLQTLQVYLKTHRKELKTKAQQNFTNILAISLVIIFLLLTFSFLDRTEVIDKKYSELLQIAQNLQTQSPPPTTNQNILNDFNSGGWLALGFFLSKPKTQTESIYKVSIDGRTLVVGQTRLKEYLRLWQLKNNWCGILEKWNVTLAILPNNTKITTAFSKTNPNLTANCLDQWQELARYKNWTVFRKRIE